MIQLDCGYFEGWRRGGGMEAAGEEGDCGAEVWANKVAASDVAATSSSFPRKRSSTAIRSVAMDGVSLGDMVLRVLDIRVRKLSGGSVRRPPSNPG